MPVTIDLRSDTVTKPGPEMLQAMVTADVGDDVFGEDPTVRELESEVATLLGKEAGVYVPSGTMCNQMAVRIHTNPGDEAILEADAHIRHYEGGAAAGLSGVQLCPVSAHRGLLTPELVEANIRAGNEWDPLSTLICIENTHNRAGGTVYPLETITSIGELARDKGLRYHLDGARLWNACVATGISEAMYCADFDTVSVCLSKGLGARHWAAAAISRATNAVAVAVSESNGTVRFFQNGEVVLRIEPFRRAMKWKDFEYEPPAASERHPRDSIEK